MLSPLQNTLSNVYKFYNHFKIHNIQYSNKQEILSM